MVRCYNGRDIRWRDLRDIVRASNAQWLQRQSPAATKLAQ